MNAARTFEFDAEKYKQASTHQQEWGTRLIAELNLRGDERILDLGCGEGVLTAKLAQVVPGGSVLGVDSSQNMIVAAEAWAGERLQFKRLDINELDFDDEFDVVFSNATLHWVKDHRRLLNNAYKALRPGGLCRFNFAADGNCATFNGVVRDLMSDPRFERFFVGFDWPWFMPRLDEYEQLFSDRSFSEHRVWGENADRHFPDAAAMTAWIDQPSLVPFLRCIDGAADKQLFRDQTVHRMLELTRQPDGTQFEMFRRINVLARK
jgi:trans-aconitate methyltransferase